MANTAFTLGGGGAGGKFVQVVNVQDGEVQGPLETAIPRDDSIPQNTEGEEVMTLAITPQDSANILKIDVVVFANCDLADKAIMVALFQDSTADALATGSQVSPSNSRVGDPITYTHYMVAGTTTSTTFKVRMGAEDTSDVTFNGNSDTRQFGGTYASSITISEIGMGLGTVDSPTPASSISSCLVQLSSDYTVQTNAPTIPWATEVYDTGSNFNTGTYTFTAPQAGRYFVSFVMGVFNLDSVTNLGDVWIDAGGTTYSIFNLGNRQTSAIGASDGITGTLIVDLSAADTIKMRMRGNASQPYTIESTESHFNITLI